MAVLHVILFQMKSGLQDAEREKLYQEFRESISQIEGVESVEIGRNFQESDPKYTDAAIVRLKDRESLAAYGPHPKHQAAGQLLRPYMEGADVVDMEI